MRWSYGTELNINLDNKESPIQVTDFQSVARINLNVKNLKISDNFLQFDCDVAGPTHTVKLVKKGENLEGLVSFGNHPTDYHTVIYTKNEDPYFVEINKLYNELDTQTQNTNLAKAIPSHLRSLEQIIGKEKIMALHLNFPIDEWDEIMVSYIYAERNDMIRAIAYMRAATELHPNSPTAQFEYGQMLANNGNSQEALNALLKAKQLSKFDPYYLNLIDRLIQDIKQKEKISN